MYTVNSPLRGAPVLTAKDWGISDPVALAYLTDLYALAPGYGVNPDLLAAQSALETDYWTSSWWIQRRNPAGIGITGDTTQNNASQTWASGGDAARAHLAHMLAYLDAEVPAGLQRYNTRATVAAKQPWAGTIKTLADLTNRWAVDNTYAQKIADRVNQLVPKGAVMSYVFGKVPHPAYVDRIIPGTVNVAWDNLGKRTIRAVCWHRMEGSLNGTDSYFRNKSATGGASRARTDYGIGVAATDGAANAGKIYMWTDPRGDMSPWANGRLSQPYGAGLAFYNMYGVNAINRDIASIEISGQADTPLDDQSRNAIAALTAYWADQYRVPWDTFPKIPAEGRDFLTIHQMFTIGTGKLCPYKVVIGELPALVARVKAILKQYQVPQATVPATPDVPAFAKPGAVPEWDGKDKAVNSKVFFACRRFVTANADGVPMLQYADEDAAQTRKPLQRGEAVEVMYAVQGTNNKWYWIAVDGSRFLMAQATPQVTFKK